MPSPREGAGWVATLQSQPWFAQVESVWRGAGVPDWIAEGVIANEDTSLDLNAKGTDAPSVGLYQINLDAHPDVTRAEASDPVWSSQWFASQVEPILVADPELKDPANIPALVQRLEGAGWPGKDPVLDALETPQRIADMQESASQNNAIAGQPAPTTGQYNNPWSQFWNAKPNGALVGPNSIVNQQLTNAQQAFMAFIGNELHTIALVLLGVVLFAVAIVWLAGHEIADALRPQQTTPATTGAPTTARAPEAEAARDLAAVAL